MVKSPDSSPQAPFDSNAVVSDNFPLGASGDSSPKLEMCQKNDGKKWWCSKTAIPNEKYCKRHIYKRRGYSRKNVAGEGSEVSKFDQEEATFVGGSSSISTPPARVATTPNQSINFSSDAEGPGVGSHVNNQNIDEPILSKFALEEDSEMNLKDYFLDFSDLESQEQYSLRHLFDNWPMEQPKYADWSKHSMNNIPTSSSNRTSTSSSSQQEKPL